MQIIAGKFKGHIIKLPKLACHAKGRAGRGVKIRPTSQKVKAALFNVLGGKIEGASFLELFAGSGNIGIEAASRGAGVLTLVESNRFCIRTIEENLRHIGMRYSYGLAGLDAGKGTGTILLPLDAERALRLLCQKGRKFDFLFLDPPYYQDKLKNCLIKVCSYDILKSRSLVIAEHSKGEILPPVFSGLRLMLTKRYGDTILSFYEKVE